MNKTDTLAAIKALGLSARCTDGEYRVTARLEAVRPYCPSQGVALLVLEAWAYYTDCGEDALAAAKTWAVDWCNGFALRVARTIADNGFA